MEVRLREPELHVTGRQGAEDFIGNRIWDMFPAHLGTEYEEHCRAAMDRGETRRFEMRGRYTDACYRMTAFPSADGITLLGTDITEHKRAEEALRESEALLRAVIETVADPLFVKDTESRHTLANPATVALIGKPGGADRRPQRPRILRRPGRGRGDPSKTTGASYSRAPSTSSRRRSRRRPATG